MTDRRTDTSPQHCATHIGYASRGKNDCFFSENGRTMSSAVANDCVNVETKIAKNKTVVIVGRKNYECAVV